MPLVLGITINCTHHEWFFNRIQMLMTCWSAIKQPLTQLQLSAMPSENVTITTQSGSSAIVDLKFDHQQNDKLHIGNAVKIGSTQSKYRRHDSVQWMAIFRQNAEWRFLPHCNDLRPPSFVVHHKVSGLNIWRTVWPRITTFTWTSVTI